MTIIFQRWRTTCRWLFNRQRLGSKIFFIATALFFMLFFRYKDQHHTIVNDDNSRSSFEYNSDNKELDAMQPDRGFPMCPETPPGLGTIENLENSTTDPSLPFLPETRQGGWWQSTQCRSKFHIAIIIPYRDRSSNLQTLLSRLHPMLQHQLLHYQIFVAEQEGNGTFNKGRVMNSAFKLVQSLFPVYDCFIFHDVDMVPENERNLYVCDNDPKHLSPAVNKFNYSLPYPELIGGVLAMTSEQFKNVNGYANVFWGWGGEDDDMYYRIRATGYRVLRPPLDVGSYTMLQHARRTWISHKRTYDLLGRWRHRHRKDGISNVKYELMSMNSTQFYTHLFIRLDTIDAQ